MKRTVHRETTGKRKLTSFLSRVAAFGLCLALLAAACGCSEIKNIVGPIFGGDSSEESAESSRDMTGAVRVGSLKGPTTMGLVQMMSANEKGTSIQNYEFTMATQADEIAAKIVKGELDIALIPANLAAVLYQKTNRGIVVVDINTLGVLYGVTAREGIESFEDLDGETVLMTGQGTTPEYAMRYLMDKYDVECELEFHSEATEIAALLKQDPEKIAVLPQPFVTTAIKSNPDLASVFSLSKLWDEVSEDSRMVTGVTVVRSEFWVSHPAKVNDFLLDHTESVSRAKRLNEATSKLVVQYGILGNEQVAALAIPECNLVCITGQEMKDTLSGYLETLYSFSPEAVGGELPSDSFYYVP